MDLTGLGSVFSFAQGVIERIFPDPTQRAQAALELEKLRQSGELAKLAAETDLLKGQIEINKIEASSTKGFIAYARPFILWTCGCAFAYATILEPIARFIAKVAFTYAGEFPVIDTNLTIQVLLGLLGLSGLRSLEKVRGAEGNR